MIASSGFMNEKDYNEYVAKTNPGTDLLLTVVLQGCYWLKTDRWLSLQYTYLPRCLGKHHSTGWPKAWGARYAPRLS